MIRSVTLIHYTIINIVVYCDTKFANAFSQ